MVNEDSLVLHEARCKVLLLQPEQVNLANEVLALQGRHSYFEVVECTNGQRSNVGAASLLLKALLNRRKVEKPTKILRQQPIGVGANDSELAASDGSKRAVENRRGHSRATSCDQNVARPQLTPGGARKVEVNQVRISVTDGDVAVFGDFTDSDQAVRAVGLMPRSIGTAKRDAELHGGDLAQFDLC